MSQEQYFYGQGKVKIAEVIAGVVGAYIWTGDVSVLNVGFTEEKATHRESYSGGKSKVREFNVSQDMNVNLTLHDQGTGNIARFSLGSASSKLAGTVTAEELPNPVVVGTEYSLANPGVSSLVITDSLGSPATIAPEHYTLDAAFGNLVFNTLPNTPAPTMPLKAAYSYAATQEVAFLNSTQKTYALRYEGVNLAEGGAPVIVELYRLSTGLLQQLDLITSGNALAGMQVTGSVLRDTSKPATGPLGQMGRIIQVGSAA